CRRRAGSGLGRGGLCRVRAPRGRRRHRGRACRIPQPEGAALQAAQALRLLGRPAEIRLWQGAQAPGARRAGGARPDRAGREGQKLMRQIRQPGPVAAERIEWVEACGRAFTFTLPAGLTLLEAVRSGFAEAGFASGTVNFAGAALGPFAYVMPALSA